MVEWVAVNQRAICYPLCGSQADLTGVYRLYGAKIGDFKAVW